ncbi:hypothetical protein [Adlercreutzia sp. ZJ304]|uniref:hypothetical protein n=1 Tax=Adlercreutzia sp. ZJ304 TaxID=2709791 RepID=UPI0013EA6FEF|nr:hypothetical protein [Adlercreutzia sp. ZJ304]
MSETDSHITSSASTPVSSNVKSVPLSSITNTNGNPVRMPVAASANGQAANQPHAQSAPASAPVATTPNAQTASSAAPSSAKPAPTPAVAVPGVAATTAQPTAAAEAAPKQPNLPVAVPMPEYHPVAGAINPSGPRPKQPKKHNGLLIAGIIVCALAAIALICALCYIMSRPHSVTVNAPSADVVEKAYESADINVPTLSDYSYINTEGLDDPQISNIQIGEVTSSGSGDAQKTSCSTTAQVVFENESVRVDQTLQLPFTYNASSSQWEAGKPSVQSSGEKVEPTGPADVAALQAALPELLKAYDANIASQYEGAAITANSNLSATGGDVTFTLDKTNADGTHMRTDANVGVAWDETKGWVPTINWIGTAPNNQGGNPNTNQNQPTNENNNGSNGSTSENTGGANGGDMLLTCSTGDLVEVPGVIEYRDDRVLLRSDYTIRVILDGKTYVTSYFELTANTFVVTNGAHVSVIGEISATGTLPQAPLMINLDYED